MTEQPYHLPEGFADKLVATLVEDLGYVPPDLVNRLPAAIAEVLEPDTTKLPDWAVFYDPNRYALDPAGTNVAIPELRRREMWRQEQDSFRQSASMGLAEFERRAARQRDAWKLAKSEQEKTARLAAQDS